MPIMAKNYILMERIEPMKEQKVYVVRLCRMEDAVMDYLHSLEPPGTAGAPHSTGD